MNNFAIKTEYYPKRCEICHKNDLFDKSLNFCLRCKEHYPAQTKKTYKNKQSLFLTPAQKQHRKYVCDKASNYLLGFSLLFTTLILFALQSHKIENFMGWLFCLLICVLAFSGSIIAAYLDKKIYGKTFIKMMVAVIFPMFSVIMFFVRIMISLFGTC